MIGPIINSSAVIVGSIIGASIGKFIPERIRTRLPLVFGCIAMGIGVVMIQKVQTLPAAVLAFIMGAILGELLNIEAGIQRMASKARAYVEKVVSPPAGEISEEEFMDKFMTMIILFCASGITFFGSMTEGMTGDPTLLIIKAFLDLLTAIIFAVSLGYTLAVVSIPMFIVQVSLYLAASTIVPLTTPIMIDDFSAVGGFIILATGFNISGLATFPIANMLPALIIAMPISSLWVKFLG